MPGSFPIPATQPSQGAQFPTSTSCLDDISIPSPLLYHKRSRELLARSWEDDIPGELTRLFVLKCGQDLPEPDFESYKLFDETTATPSAVPEQQAFVAARLPVIDSKLRGLRNIPHPPWIQQSSRLPSGSTSPLLRATTGSSTPKASSHMTSSSNATVIGPKMKRSTTYDYEQPLQNLTSSDLIFPTLTMSGQCVDSPIEARSFGLWDSPSKKPQFIDDDPDIIFKRWSAFEQIINQPKDDFQPCEPADQSRKASKGKWSAGATSEIDSPTSPEAKANVRPPVGCMDLVPARLYTSQFIGWPSRVSYQPDYHMASYPTLRAPVSGDSDANQILKMARWLEDFGYGKMRVPKLLVAADLRSSFDEDFKTTPDPEPIDAELIHHSDVTVSPSEATDSPPVDVRDEGYFTCQESGSEIGVEESTLSDDDWPEWDWEPEDQDQEKDNLASKEDTDFDSDPFGIGWGF